MMVTYYFSQLTFGRVGCRFPPKKVVQNYRVGRSQVYPPLCPLLAARIPMPVQVTSIPKIFEGRKKRKIIKNSLVKIDAVHISDFYER